MPVSGQPPQRTGGIRPIVGGLPDVAYPEEQYSYRGVGTPEQQAQERAVWITQENKEYARERAAQRQAEFFEQQRSLFALGLAASEVEARERYAGQRERVKQQILYGLERRPLLARYGVGVPLGAEVSPSKSYEVSAGRMKGTILYRVKPSGFANENLAAQFESKIEADLRKQDVGFEGSVTDWRNKSWNQYEQWLSGSFPVEMFLEPEIPKPKTPQPPSGFQLPDVTGFLLSWLPSLRTQVLERIYGKGLGGLMAKQEQYMLQRNPSDVYFSIGTVASVQAFSYSIANFLGAQGPIPSTWFSAIFNAQERNLPFQYYMGSFFGDLLIGKAIGSAVSTVGKATGISYAVRFRGSSIDKFLFERSGLYQRLTGGMAKTMFSAPRVGWSVPEIYEDYWDIAMQRGTSMLFTNPPLGAVTKYLPEYLAWGRVGIFSMVPEFQRGFEHVYQAMPPNYLQAKGPGLSLRDLIYGTRASTSIPQLIGQYRYAETIGLHLASVGRSMFESPSTAFYMLGASAVRYQNMRSIPSIARLKATSFGASLFEIPKAPTFNIPRGLWSEPTARPRFGRIRPILLRRSSLAREAPSVTIPYTPSRLYQRRANAREAFAFPIEIPTVKRLSRISPLGRQVVGPIPASRQIVKPKVKMIQTPKNIFPSPHELTPSREISRLRDFGGAVSPVKRKGKRKAMGSMWGKRAYPVMTGEEFMVRGFLGKRKK